MAKFNVGDQIFSIRGGWMTVKRVDVHSTYPVETELDRTYTMDGYAHSRDKFQSIFTVEEAANHNFPPPKPEVKFVEKTMYQAVLQSPGSGETYCSSYYYDSSEKAMAHTLAIGYHEVKIMVMK